MINREDLVFAACSQLAGLISSDWETNKPEEVQEALSALSPLDEPGEIYYGNIINGLPQLKLSPSEAELESIKKVRKLIELQMVTNIFKLVMKHSDGWETSDSDVIKKEIVARISDYESEYKKLIEPVPFDCNITI